jgi:hypothetical protein
MSTSFDVTVTFGEGLQLDSAFRLYSVGDWGTQFSFESGEVSFIGNNLAFSSGLSEGQSESSIESNYIEFQLGEVVNKGDNVATADDTLVLSLHVNVLQHVANTDNSVHGLVNQLTSSAGDVSDEMAITIQVSCPLLVVPSSDTSDVAGVTTDTHTVTCNNGYASNDGASFTATCSNVSPGVSEWTNHLTCETVSCDPLTVPNSDTTAHIAKTNDVHVITCADGYSSSDGPDFSATCSPDSPGVSTWTDVLTCEVVSCPPLTVENSDTTNHEGMTHDTHTVSCWDGYPSANGITFSSTCTGTAPGVSAWSNANLFCGAVQCPPLTVALSDTEGHLAFTGESREVVCDPDYGEFGAGSWDGLTFIATCQAISAYEATWTNALECLEVDCSLEPLGDLVLDVCGVCDGDGKSCVDCAGIPHGTLVFDECGICGGDGKSCVAYTIGSSIDSSTTDDYFHGDASQLMLSRTVFAALVLGYAL